MKTPDEIKKGLKCCNGDSIACKFCSYNNYLGYGCTKLRNDDALTLIQQLEATQPKWISVDERLPEPGNKILIAFPHSILGFTLHVGEYTGKVWWMESAIIDTPPYWTHLPEMPKEDEP